MYILIAVLTIISMAVPFTDTSNIDWEDDTWFPSMSGCAAYYADGNMAKTMTAFGYTEKSSGYYNWLDENGYLGAVAVYRKGDMGKDVHILWPDGTIDGPYIAIDVVAKHHYNLGLSKNRVVDVDYNTAMRHEMRGPVAVTIIYDYTSLMEVLYNGYNSFTTDIVTKKYEGCINQNEK